ncbi:hypothetical protein POM88_020673 [Heracleum sosnowskyi]|uniref:MBD domain-containing protein n=1 Tax=Heracleum sosnowskyi TaxID=360622 RepID=A0AAD8MT37_9APIA|nr:hypothetical protein POM88_020673 [Heracleum sosnowskyi]
MASEHSENSFTLSDLSDLLPLPYFPTDPNEQNQHVKSSKTVAVPGFDPVSKSDPVSNTDTGLEVTEAPVGESSDPVAGAGSDPGLGSDTLMSGLEVKLWRGSKQRNTRRKRESWEMGCSSMELAGSNQTEVDCSRGKRGRRSRKGTKDGKKNESWLPSNWTVIRKTRTTGATTGVIDKYYVEPETHKRFRSKIAVQRYLESLERARKKRQRDEEDKQEKVGSSAELSI